MLVIIGWVVPGRVGLELADLIGPILVGRIGPIMVGPFGPVVVDWAVVGSADSLVVDRVG